MKPMKIITFIVAAVVAIAAIGMFAGGIGLSWVYGTQRDSAGYLTSPSYELSTPSYAIVTDNFDLASRPGDWFPTDVADVRIDASSDSALFVGIGPAEAVEEYLAAVAVDRIDVLGTANEDITYRTLPGGAPASLPATQDFWVATSVGAAETLNWDVSQGEWAAVVMNADGSAGVTAATTLGVETGAILLAIGISLSLAGLLFGALAATGLVWATRRDSTSTSEARLGSLAGVGVYPTRLEATLDPELSRWKWLFKWILVIPHVVVLAFLWVGFAVLTVLAFFAILFTGSYPRSIFDFNVGVMRWSWRVGFYAYSALGTDEYPPFTLADADYPAHFDVEYPEQLSRGLALVKWWLLAIPHYLIVGVFTSGIVWWATETGGDAALQLGGGLIGLLALVAGFALAFTGRYPQGLFDLIIGLNRWVFRVAAYVALMSDEYPPFRLDVGGDEPSQESVAPPNAPRTGTAFGTPIPTG